MAVAVLPALLCVGLVLSRAQAAPASTANLTSRAQSAVPVGVIINHCTVPGVVALTFDDGPFVYTSRVLDHLDQYGARATFFVNGENWSRGIADPSTPWPEILRRIDRSGHQIGSHTWSHADLSAASPQARQYQVHQLDTALRVVLGKSPTYLRPPYASCSSECLSDLERMGYHVVNFDVDPKDYLHNRPDDIASAMENFSRALDGGGWGNSFLVLSHDSLRQTAEALVPHMLEEIQHRGYRAVTVGECLGDPPENWYRWG
ncbi:carbohydrate esterase family 4 protein [Thermothielavioides terrestris NRRL 8126]|uniref:Carbohydrate esterase family 4 protein n=1 Tax=Thermothielavioides terrestris (strain ATCC 38088 / NRRL 8126) TaxID=578455 RepID=G2RA64_THETT|nr:carbohydrate esterase family 4 protein [Thermothielavioides terrestris NRRL 8126]AEO69652.1 carbohydrate esterase family 4 protein [Thermothielavioides terrestris NRRL 8126]